MSDLLSSWLSLDLEARIYEVALVLLALSLILYSRILRRILMLTDRTWWSWLPMAGALLVLGADFLHAFVQIELMPLVKAPEVYRQIMGLRSLSLAGMLLAGLLSLAAGLACYLPMGDD